MGPLDLYMSVFPVIEVISECAVNINENHVRGHCEPGCRDREKCIGSIRNKIERTTEQMLQGSPH